MPVATRISTALHHPRTHSLSSHISSYQVYENQSDSTVSGSSEGVERTDVAVLRRGRAGNCEDHPDQRRSRAKRAMTSHTPRRTYSHSLKHANETYGKEPRVVVREVRRTSNSEHRHHHRKSEREDQREDGNVHVYKAHKKTEGEADRSRPSTLRRSKTDAGDASRTRTERRRTGDTEPPRRHSERRLSHHEERVHTPLRREKRSIVDNVPKSTRDRPPVTR